MSDDKPLPLSRRLTPLTTYSFTDECLQLGLKGRGRAINPPYPLTSISWFLAIFGDLG